jgi:hypothetical protein
LDVKDWKAHTEYNGYKLKDRQIGWFWKVSSVLSLLIDMHFFFCFRSCLCLYYIDR